MFLCFAAPVVKGQHFLFSFVGLDPYEIVKFFSGRIIHEHKSSGRNYRMCVPVSKTPKRIYVSKIHPTFPNPSITRMLFSTQGAS